MDPIIILFIVLSSLFFGGVTYKAVTEPEVFALSAEVPPVIDSITQEIKP